MTFRPVRSGIVAWAVLCAGFLDVAAADDVVSQIPDNSLGYAVVQDVQEANGKIQQAAQHMRLPGIDLLQMAKQRLGVDQEVVDSGDMALAIVAQATDRPFPVILVRTKDYGQLLKKLDAKNVEGPISELTVGGETSLVAAKGSYAVFAPPMFRDGLLGVVKSQKCVAVDSRTKEFTAESDAYAVITPGGVQLLSQQVLGALQMAKQRFSQAGPQGDAVVMGLSVYEELFKWVSQEVQEVDLVLQFADDGSIHLKKRVQFQNPIELAGEDAAGIADRGLASLPAWPYAVAVAGTFGDSQMMEKWMRLSMQMMRAMAGDQEITDEQVERLVEVSRKSMQGLHGMSFVFGVPTEGGSIYSRMGLVMEVDDAEAYLDRYVQAMQQMQEILADVQGLPYRILSAERCQVAGMQGLKLEMQIMTQELVPGAEQFEGMFDKLYGEDGKIVVYAAPINAKQVALAYVSEENLREMIQMAKSTGKGLAADSGIQVTSQLLSKDAKVAGFISPEGSLQFVRRMMEMVIPAEQKEQIPSIPAFPASPPLGFTMAFGGDAFEGALVLPVQTQNAFGEYIQMIRSGSGQ